MSGKQLPPIVRLAASMGVKGPVESYLRAGNDPNSRDARMRPLLLHAAAGGNADICRLLVEYGADPLLQDPEGDDALSAAIGKGNTEAATVLQSFIAPGASSHSACTSNDSSITDTVETDIKVNPDTVADHEVTEPDQWEVSIDPLPPPDDPMVRTGAAKVQHQISEHEPIDSNSNWADVEIELPPPGTQHGSAHALWLDEVRSLIHFGLSWGWVTAGQVAVVAGNRGGREDVDEIESRLRIVLGDVGILVEWDDRLEQIANQICGDHLNNPNFVNGDDRAIDDALIFLDDLTAFQDPLTCYWKDIQQLDTARRRKFRGSLHDMRGGQKEI